MSDPVEPPGVTESGQPDGDPAEAVASLEALGLSSYEAQVFVALHRLDGGTAKTVSDVAGVPRSQVYGTAEALAERGLVEQVESAPKRYRPVPLSAARAQLSSRLRREQERAFDNLAALQDSESGDDEGTGVATLRGRHAVRERVGTLVGAAADRVVYVAPTAAQASEDVAAALRERAGAGVAVTLVAGEAALVERFADADLRVVDMSDDDMTGFTGRTLLVDDATVLLSVVPGPEDPESAEVALWTDGTSVGRILGRFVQTGMEAGMERAGGREDSSRD